VGWCNIFFRDSPLTFRRILFFPLPKTCQDCAFIPPECALESRNPPLFFNLMGPFSLVSPAGLFTPHQLKPRFSQFALLGHCPRLKGRITKVRCLSSEFYLVPIFYARPLRLGSSVLSHSSFQISFFFPPLPFGSPALVRSSVQSSRVSQGELGCSGLVSEHEIGLFRPGCLSARISVSPSRFFLLSPVSLPALIALYSNVPL